MKQTVLIPDFNRNTFNKLRVKGGLANMFKH